MKTCGTCKYFGPDEPDSAWGEESRFRKCMLMENRAFERSESIQASAYVEDGSGYYAALCVSEDFGCTEWTPQ